MNKRVWVESRSLASVSRFYSLFQHRFGEGFRAGVRIIYAARCASRPGGGIPDVHLTRLFRLTIRLRDNIWTDLISSKRIILPVCRATFTEMDAPQVPFSETNPPKILLTNPSIPQVAIDLLGDKCILICTKDDKRESILEKVSGVDAIFWATKETLDKEILDRAGPQMKTVGTMSAGTNHIDIPELKKRGIKLGNTPMVLDDAVADTAILLALGAARRLHEGRLKIEQNQWRPNLQWMLGQDITGSTVGIVGLGGIGQTIVKRLKSFSVDKFLYTGHREKPEGKELGCQFVSLDTLVKESDFVIVACPLTSETKSMFNDEIFNKMKQTAVFVNISRGEVVDQDALIRALKGGKIFAAGLDVMTPEPLPPGHELLKLPNVVLLPHLGSATQNTRNAMAELTAQNILRGLGGEEMFTPVC